MPTSFSLTEGKNSSNVRCSSTFVKQHQALSHCTEEGNLHLPRFGSARSVWGCLGLSFPVPGNKSTQTIQSYVPSCQTQPETQWDKEEPSLGKVPVAFNAPQQTQSETEQGHNPCNHYTPQETPLPWPQGHGEPLLPLCHSWKLICRLETKQHLLQKGLASLEPTGKSMIDLQHHNGLQPTAGWGCSSFLDSQ